MPDGTAVELFTLTNRHGMEVRVISYGAIIQAIRVTDRHGAFADVVNGHDTLDGYRTRSRFFGAVVGRYGNRIAGGAFTLDDREYKLAVNNGPNHLHGGLIGFDHVGLGSDFDGIGTTPEGLGDVSKYPDLVAELLRRGVSDEDAAKVVGGNLLRVWKEADEVALKMQAEGVLPLEDEIPARRRA